MPRAAPSRGRSSRTSASCTSDLHIACPTMSRRSVPAGSVSRLDMAADVQDRGGRAPLVPPRRGRPRPPPLHARARARGRGREGRPQDEVALRRRGSSRSAMSSCCSTRAAASCRRSPASTCALAPRGPRGPVPAAVGLVGAEAMLRLFREQEANERAFQALTRFLDLLDDVAPRRPAGGPRPARPLVPAQAPLALRYLPHLRLRRVRGGAALAGLLAARGRRVCQSCAAGVDRALGRGLRGIEGAAPAAARPGGRGRPQRAARGRARRDHASYEYHGGFRSGRSAHARHARSA